ncbi:MAG TPA: hypothetical protein IAC64_01335 [Candidatus Caccomorpha excrementavium]|nr:hypothetical protein [Candidatus Caccomorpha excrementavium]
MRRRLKKSTKRILAVTAGILTAGLGAAAGAGVLIAREQARAADEIAAMQSLLDQNTRYVYETARAVRRGEILDENNTRMVLAYSSMNQEEYLTAEDLGSCIVIDADEGVHLLKNMTAAGEGGETLREVECEAVLLNENRQEYDVVDIRIRYPNGEDYIVLAKKELLHLNDEVKDRCYIRCVEEEIARLSASYVDALLYEGTCLYTVRYPNPELQEASVVTYVPTPGALAAMRKNPNIAQKASYELMLQNRMELEERLNGDYEEAAGIWQSLAMQAGNYETGEEKLYEGDEAQ